MEIGMDCPTAAKPRQHPTTGSACVHPPWCSLQSWCVKYHRSRRNVCVSMSCQ